MSNPIYFYVYPSAFQNPGGGEIFLLKTKEYLEKENVQIRLFDMWRHQLKEGDILHVFGSVKEALGLMEVARAKRVTIVHSPVIWYNWQSAFQIPYAWQERVACVLRQSAKSFFPFFPSDRRKMMALADVVLAGSEMEAGQINRYFGIPRRAIEVVTYGVEERYSSASGHLFRQKYGFKNFLLTVGRIEPRKNQLKLIRAASKLDRILVIIGNPVTRHMNYYERCRQEAGSNVHFVDQLPMDSEELVSAYAACEVFALPSWFETPGLAALEAGLAGAKLVVTREGSTKEYFQDLVDYVNPASERDIYEKIKNAFQKKKTNALKNRLQEHFLWEQTAKRTKKIYSMFVPLPEAVHTEQTP